MVYMVIFNKKYHRQFEAVISREEWQRYKAKYGAAWAVAIIIAGLHRIKSKKNVTKKTEESYRHFILNQFYRPDIFGTPMVKVGKNKKEVLDRNRSEFYVTSKKGSPHAKTTRLYPR